MIWLTPETREVVEHGVNLLPTACLGSGKTRVMLAELLTLADQVRTVRRPFRRRR